MLPPTHILPFVPRPVFGVAFPSRPFELELLQSLLGGCLLAAHFWILKLGRRRVERWRRTPQFFRHYLHYMLTRIENKLTVSLVKIEK